MKINEVTNAEDILGLWKLISDNTWSAIQQQAEQQAREKAERAAKTKSTKGVKTVSGRRATPIAVPKPPAVPATPQAKPAVITPVQQPLVAQGPLPSKGPWGASQVNVASAPTSLPPQPVAPSADAQQKQGTELKLSAREKGFVRK